MGAMASHITSLTIVYSSVNYGADQREHQRSASLAFVGGNSPLIGEFAAQMANNAKNVSIWWRHHERTIITLVYFLGRTVDEVSSVIVSGQIFRDTGVD